MLNTNYKFGEVNELAAQISQTADKVNFKTVFETKHGGVTLVAFKAGQKLDPHTAPFEVMVCVLEGEIKFTMLDEPHVIKAGEFMLMGSNVLHSVEALADSKVALIKVEA